MFFICTYNNIHNARHYGQQVLILAQLNCLRRLASSGIVDCCIVFLGRIYVLVAKNICNKVNITCFLIQGRTVGAAELVRCDLFGGRDLLGIFLDKILDRLDTDTAALGRVEESVFMAFQRNDILADFQITLQSFFYLRSEIYNHFISTFSGDLYSVILKIHIFNIKSHTFRNSDTGSEK